MSTRMREALQTTIKVYLVLILLVLPLYTQDGYIMIGNVKYLFFRNVTLFFVLVTVMMTVIFSAVQWREKGGSQSLFPTGAGTRLSCTDLMALFYGGSAVLSWWFSAHRSEAWQGAPGWYMGLLSQLLFVWIYFAVSRWYDGSRGILWALYAGAAVVMAVGILNRYGFDPFSMFEGLDDWDREHLLSTIGNPNWYCGYVSVASAVCICFACADGKVRRAAGSAGSILFFWTILTQGSEGGYLIVLAELAVVFFRAMEDRRRFLDFLGLLICWPAAALMGQFCVRFRGLILVEDGTLNRFLFWEGWLPVLIFLAALLLLLWGRERRGCGDRLRNGRAGRAVRWTAGVFAVAGAAVFLACQVWESFWVMLGEKSLLRITDSWGNDRGALWRVSLESFAQGSFMDQWIGVGPDCFGSAVYALYPVNDIIHPTGHWEAALFANAHNEWLNMMIDQGILGLFFYGGIFVTAFCRLWRQRSREPLLLLGILAISGYCAYGIVSFQQTVSTPLMFVVLGISEAMLRERGQQDPIGGAEAKSIAKKGKI